MNQEQFKTFVDQGLFDEMVFTYHLNELLAYAVAEKVIERVLGFYGRALTFNEIFERTVAQMVPTERVAEFKCLGKAFEGLRSTSERVRAENRKTKHSPRASRKHNQTRQSAQIALAF